MSDKLQLILESDEAMLAFKEHCAKDRTIEACGLFVLKQGVVSFVPCENGAYDKKRSFLIMPQEFVAQADEGDVIGVGHSHVIVSAKPSPEDIANSENLMLPFVVFQPFLNTVESYIPSGQAPSLIGRKWVLGVSDCYTIARDYFKQQGVELRDYVRNDMKALRTESMFLKHFEENGFHVVHDKPKTHDVFLIQVLANVPNHCAILVDANEGLILHHLQDRLSCREPYGGYWRRNTHSVLRHEKWL